MKFCPFPHSLRDQVWFAVGVGVGGILLSKLRTKQVSMVKGQKEESQDKESQVAQMEPCDRDEVRAEVCDCDENESGLEATLKLGWNKKNKIIPCIIEDDEDVRADASEGEGLKEKKNKKKNVSKLWRHFYLEPTMLRNGFDVNQKIIGHGGANTKRIFAETGAKIRLRGLGSGHCETEWGEAPVPLMLAVTADARNPEKFLRALEMSGQLLQTVTSKYPDYCRHHWQNPIVRQPLFWIGDASEEVLSSLPVPVCFPLPLPLCVPLPFPFPLPLCLPPPPLLRLPAEHVSGSQFLIGKTETTLSLDDGPEHLEPEEVVAPDEASDETNLMHAMAYQ